MCGASVSAPAVAREARKNVAILFMDLVGSTALADEMRFRLVRLGRPVATYQDGLLQRMVASTVSRECVVIALWTTGRVPEMVENCRIARNKLALTR